jgi:predicted cupin superfamily sugar epimerase
VNAEAQKIVATLGLAPLAHEGGYFRQTWRSEAGSAIYFLLTPEDFSALHRLRRADETWHFYAGDTVQHAMLGAGDAAARLTTLGSDVLAGETPQLLVPAGVWQGARLVPGGGPDGLAGLPPSPRLRRAGTAGPSTSLRAGWALVGCTLTPAWDDKDFELAGRAALEREFPGAAALIRALTR